MFNHELALDPGSENARASARGGNVITVPSLIATVERGQMSLVGTEAVGRDALSIAARSQRERVSAKGLAGVTLVNPISRGAVSDAAAAEKLFSHIFREAPGRTWGARPSILCGVSPGLTAAEQRGLVDALDRSGAKRIRLVPSLAACALALEKMSDGGSGAARLIVELGAERTGIGIASKSGVLASRGLAFGARDMDRIFLGRLKRQGLQIGLDEARDLREGLGMPSSSTEGLDSWTGALEILEDVEDILPRHVGGALAPYVLHIADEIRDVMARAPDEAASDILAEGVMLAGGASAMPGLAEFLSNDLQMPVRKLPMCQNLRIKGLVEYMDEEQLLKDVCVDA
jgi:rod shape-determining protein MreB